MYKKPNRVQVVLNLAKTLPVWWYYYLPIWYVGFCKRILTILEDRLAVGLTLKLLATPLYQDYTIVGFVIGPLIRSIKLVVGVTLLLTVSLILFPPLILWYLFEALIFILPQQIDLITEFVLINLIGLIIYILSYFSFNFKPIRKSKNLYDWSDWNVRNILEPSQTASQLFNKFWNKAETKKILERLSVTEEIVNEISPQLLENVTADVILSDCHTRKPGELISIQDCLVGFFRTNEKLLRIFEKRGITVPEVSNVVWWDEQENLINSPPSIFSGRYVVHTKGGVNRSWSALPTKFLDTVSKDLTEEVRAGISPFIIPRHQILNEIEKSLERSKSSHVLLNGKPGSGKTSLLYSLAEKIISGGKSKALWDKRVILLNPTELTGGSKNPNEIELRFTEVLNEVVRSGNIILCIDDIHTILLPNEKAELNPILKVLMSNLSSNRFNLIATTTPDGFREYLEPDQNFLKNLQRIDVEEAPVDEVLPIVELKALEYEKRYEGLKFTYLALLRLVELTDRLIHDRVFPDKAFNSMETVVNSLGSKNVIVTPELITSVISKETHVPLSTTKEEKEELLDLEQNLAKRVIGQTATISEIATILRRGRVGVVSKNRPVGSLLVAGPTGVGKTEIARSLADIYFGDSEMMIRLDMSEYQTNESVARLIGGMIDGKEQFGILSEAVKHKPAALILLDELEKADPSVLDIFLQILEDGRATDGNGETIDFTNNLIYATSNVGSEQIIAALNQGMTVSQIKTQLDEILFKTFKPEFLNRFDGIVYANALSLQDVSKIAEIQLDDLAQRVKHEHNIKLSFTDEFVTGVAQLGFTPTLGARPLRRVIQDRVEALLATQILEGKLKPGDSFVLTPQLLVNQI